MEAQLGRDDFGAEIALADEQRHDEHARGDDFGEHGFDVRFLFPERLAHFRKDFPLTQFRRVLVHRRGGLVVQRRAVAEHNQRGVGEIFVLHGGIFAGRPAARKLANVIFYETF